MRKQFQHRQFQPLEGPLEVAPPLSQATHHTKKLTLPHGLNLKPMYRQILLCLLLLILLAFLYYKQVPIASVQSSTSRMAICLMGGARRFELTGPTNLKHVLNVFPEADLFVHSNLDENSFKLSLLRSAPRVTEVRIRRPVELHESEVLRSVITANFSPNGLQGYLQYFNLVEGCLDMIRTQESHGSFKYDWIVRTRVDGYWTGPLDRKTFKTGSYVVPEGSRFEALNDRLGIGNRFFSEVALSRLSLLPRLASAGFHDLYSESAFHTQLKIFNIPAAEFRFPFCILSDRPFPYPPDGWLGVPIASLGSRGPLSGAYCRPCIPQCKGECMEQFGPKMDKYWSWTEWRNGSLELCDGRGPWQEGWEEIFNKVAGNEATNVRLRIKEMKMEDCVREMEGLKSKAERWNGPDPIEICKLGLQQVGQKSRKLFI
ncbi:hypothetical protein FCM35_KLT20677 [Carex littledalei]|uniref:DUF7796 domain-containing protein n=1 Tax=Carex littledalei TaxID=544730 RepID=A0A833QVV4_9POAL|nr:hypothetical protein FCM35_KLT20677 [Carex littledalei]